MMEWFAIWGWFVSAGGFLILGIGICLMLWVGR